jgi:hypothetical protein
VFFLFAHINGAYMSEEVNFVTLLKDFGPSVVPAFTLIGFVVVALRWPPLRAIVLGEIRPRAGDETEDGEVFQPERRRRGLDPVVQQLVAQNEQLIKQNAEIMGMMIQVVKDNTSAIQGVAKGLESNGERLDKYHDTIHTAFSDIHRRLDLFVGKLG